MVELRIARPQISAVLRPGVIDVLTIIPVDQIADKGIRFLTLFQIYSKHGLVLLEFKPQPAFRANVGLTDFILSLFSFLALDFLLFLTVVPTSKTFSQFAGESTIMGSPFTCA
ncbi:hypothetical protein PC118_g8961 [Phytophthora cactorum]|uniref:Uncharacterized protein n=1 Tax=Phytophthora cactorum TaxID=29920 RepID=A0A8T1G4J2_9STRA|nr:hypothetical protein PC118_g8961 [Phytophthora cactorum]